jgi:hypothetical protein
VLPQHQPLSIDRFCATPGDRIQSSIERRPFRPPPSAMTSSCTIPRNADTSRHTPSSFDHFPPGVHNPLRTGCKVPNTHHRSVHGTMTFGAYSQHWSRKSQHSLEGDECDLEQRVRLQASSSAESFRCRFMAFLAVLDTLTHLFTCMRSIMHGDLPCFSATIRSVQIDANRLRANVPVSRDYVSQIKGPTLRLAHRCCMNWIVMTSSCRKMPASWRIT